MFLFTMLSVNGRDKYEHESRLKIETVPEQAVNLMNALSLEKRRYNIW